MGEINGIQVHDKKERSMALLDVGQMDRRVGIRAYTTSENDFGEPIDTWATLATVWGKVEWGAGTTRDNREDFEQGKETVWSGIEVTIRHRTDINEKMRLLIGGEDYDIKTIENYDKRGRDRYLIIKAVKNE